MRVQCTLCDTILDSEDTYGQMSCHCGTIYYIRNWITNDVELMTNRQGVALMLDEDNDGYEYDLWEDE